jgi:peroxiredoxin
MYRIRSLVLASLAASVLLEGALFAQTKVDHWSGTAAVHDQKVPVYLDLSQPNPNGDVSGSFINGSNAVQSSSGQLVSNHLVLNFDYFARKLEGDIDNGAFTGTYSGARGVAVPIVLHSNDAPAQNGGASEPNIKPIVGDWEVAVHSPKGESAWTLRISPVSSGGHSRGEIKAVILRIDGDTGGLYGTYDAGLGGYRVSHFTAAGPDLYSIKQQSDGTLLLTNLLRDGQQWTAQRPAEARKQNLAPPTRTTDQTGVVDPSRPLTFSAPDLSGNLVSNTDSRFRGKVVIVAIGGSWCPNCHDEAPFLVDLYNRYHSRGLEIVNISFEEEAQLKDPQRLRSFINRYHIPYTVLLGGTPDQVNQKLPQGKNLNCWPTSFFIGRDGLVKESHAGFSSPDTGAAYTDLKKETDSLVESLLAQQ